MLLLRSIFKHETHSISPTVSVKICAQLHTPSFRGPCRLYVRSRTSISASPWVILHLQRRYRITWSLDRGSSPLIKVLEKMRYMRFSSAGDEREMCQWQEGRGQSGQSLWHLFFGNLPHGVYIYKDGEKGAQVIFQKVRHEHWIGHGSWHDDEPGGRNGKRHTEIRDVCYATRLWSCHPVASITPLHRYSSACRECPFWDVPKADVRPSQELESWDT